MFFQYDNKKIIFDNVSFNINQGSFHGLIGSNGCGKTTLFKMIVGGIQGYSGKINFNIGDKIVSYFPSHISFPSNLTVFQYLKNELRLIWKCSVGLKLKIIKLLKTFNISDCLNKNPNHLSSGQQKQIELIRIILERPKLIFLDEPMNYLDHATRETFFHFLQLLNKSGVTIIISSHNLQELKHYINSATIIYNSKIAFNGPVNKDDIIEIYNKITKAEMIKDDITI